MKIRSELNAEKICSHNLLKTVHCEAFVCVCMQSDLEENFPNRWPTEKLSIENER